MRRIVAVVFVVVGLVGLLGAVLGVVVGLRLVGDVDVAVTSAVGATRQTADSVDGVLETVDGLSAFVEQFGGPSLVPDDLGIDRGLIDSTEQSVAEQLDRARLLIVLAGVAFAATQLVPLWLGWVLLDPARIRRVLELPERTAPERPGPTSDR